MNLKLLSTQRSRLSGKSRQSGVALVLVLAFVTILTVMLIAFVSKARYDVSASGSFSNGISADALAQDAVNTLIGSLQEEIESHSTVEKDEENDVAIYAPKLGFILPEEDENLKNIDPPIRNLLRSGTTLKIEGKNVASTSATEDKASNGRFISKEQWNSARLLTQADNDRSPIPKWIYVSRKGPAALGTNSGKADPDNMDYVVGRFAYRIYDVSGLLDINAVGYPNGVPDDRIGRKGSLAWVDVTGAGGGEALIPADILEWRGAREEQASDYDKYVDGFGQKYGFLLTPDSDKVYEYVNPDTGEEEPVSFPPANRFLGRQDLLAYVNAHPELFPGEEAKEQFLTQVTTFSREVNAPSDPAASLVDSPQEMNPFVPNVRVDRAFTRRDGTQAVPGESLMKSRFPLSKIDLFRQYYTATGNKSNILNEIERYFGLRFNTADGTWTYVHGRKNDSSFSGGPRERLKTLKEVAEGDPGDYASTDNLPREPNFFEVLQAGIKADSLGIAANGYKPEMNQNIARHVLQIGVNIIDQYDTDDDPTVIAREPVPGGGMPQESADRLRELTFNLGIDKDAVDPDISGIENLPYIQMLGDAHFRRFDKGVTQGQDKNPIYPYLASYFQFQLWNPHRNANQALEEGRFHDLRIVAVGEAAPQLEATGTAGNGERLVAEEPVTNEVVAGEPEAWIQFREPMTDVMHPETRSAVTFDIPYLLNADMENKAGFAVSDKLKEKEGVGYKYAPDFTPGFPNPNAKILGFWSGDIYADWEVKYKEDTDHPGLRTYQNRFGAGTGFGGSQMYTDTKNLSFQLQKRSSHNQDHWLPVQTLVRFVPGQGLASGIKDTTGVQLWFANHASNSHEFHKKPMITCARILGDPRIQRCGFETERFTEQKTPSGQYVNKLPKEAGKVINSTDSYKIVSYTDRDGKTRITDAMQDSTLPSPYNRNLSAEKNPGRPVMLNRPFRTVAEMGSASRDLPWKTLNLTQDEATGGVESTADSALMDLFSLTETPVRAGTVNLNSASEKVLALLIKNANLAPIKGIKVETKEEKEETEAENYQDLAKEIRTYIDSGKEIGSVADISKMIQSCPAADGWSKLKKEAVIAALADVHNARTWNLLIDVVAQAGHLSAGGTGEDFQPNGQKRMYVHLAIDRYTGKVVDRIEEQP